MRRYLRRDTAPPDFFRFTHPETGYISRGVSWWDWKNDIYAHREGNSLPIPENMMDIAEDQLCGLLSPEHCEHSEGTTWVNTRFGMEDVKNGMKAFAKFLAGGLNFVTPAEAERRAYICAGCPLNVQAEGCGTCVKIASLITGEVAKRTTPYDGQLKTCAICKCINAVAVHFPMDAIAAATTPVQEEAFPDWCWKKVGAENCLANDSGVAQMVERRTHNPKVGDSSSPPATYLT